MRYYQYEGLISSMEHPADGPGRYVILDDLDDGSKPPVGLRILCSGLAEYLEDRGWTDAEERYLKQTWLFDEGLVLAAVIIPSRREGIPAKVIACAEPNCYSDMIRVFGPREYIETEGPEPMDREDWAAWNEFRLRYGLRPENE